MRTERPITYYSAAWVRACAERLNGYARNHKPAAKLNGSFSFRLWDGPDGKDRLAIWRFERGRCVDVTFEAREAPWHTLRRAPFNSGHVGRFSCSFDLMAKINRREVSPARALVSPQYQVEGKKLLMVSLLPTIQWWADLNATVPCRYDFSATDDEGNAIGKRMARGTMPLEQQRS